MSFHHSPVLVADVLSALAPRPGGIYVDGTVGGAGHAWSLLKAAGPGARLIGIDRDREALEASRERLAEFGDSVVLIHGNFADLSSFLEDLGIDRGDGILLDLGVSSHQLDDGSRGFSFQQDAPLDMRMDRTGTGSSFDLVNTCPEEERAALIRTYGEERMSRRIARAVCSRRETAPIATTVELASVVASALPAAMRHGPIHPATRTFQALRIAVNGELDSLRRVLTAGVDRLSVGGRFAVIAFHSRRPS
jgi:16S rRNA (cytosine1402-N4)-methyltransferase